MDCVIVAWISSCCTDKYSKGFISFSIALCHLSYNALCLCTENSEGKYISPFHDIPIYANEAEVSVTCLFVNSAWLLLVWFPNLYKYMLWHFFFFAAFVAFWGGALGKSRCVCEYVSVCPRLYCQLRFSAMMDGCFFPPAPTWEHQSVSYLNWL